MRELVFINTIGLTGSDLVAAALNGTAGLRVLPGQNFIQHDKALYRPHTYARASAPEVFAQLNREQIMKSGRIWMGLTKHMNSAERAAYNRTTHEGEFCARLGAPRDYLHCVTVYAEAYFIAAGRTLGESDRIAICGGNFALNSRDYPDFGQQVHVIDVTNHIYTWLAMINQRMTFDCVAACQFWLVNRLWLARFGLQHRRYTRVALEDYHRDPNKVIAGLQSQLGLSAGVKKLPEPGVLAYNPTIMAGVLADADMLRRIYHRLPLFDLAENFEAKGAHLLERPEINRLLDRYQAYWNTTGHTNFDVIGPIEQELIANLGVDVWPAKISTSVWFYHRAFQLDSDHYDTPVAHWRHPLGHLEDEIELPRMPFFLKIAVRYLQAIIEGYRFFLHSYLPLRNQAIYRRLQDPAFKKKAVECGFSAWLEDLEKQIDEIEAQVKREGGGIA